MSSFVSARCRGIAPSLTLAIDAKAKALAQAGRPVIGFGAGEPDFDTPAHISAAGHEAIDKGMTRYTPASGTLELRKAIVQKLQNENGLAYTPEQVVVANGAKHALFNVFEAIVDPGDEVIIPTPCWVSYPEMVRVCGGIPVYVKTTEAENFVLSAEAFEKAITDKTRALVLTSPSNPTGAVYTRAQLEALAEVCVRRGVMVISDEIYEDLVYEGQEHVSIASVHPGMKDLTFVVNGVSKSYAMTGWRIGYVAGPLDTMKAIANFQSQTTSNPSSISQHAALIALQSGKEKVLEMVAAFDARRQYMCRRIAGMKHVSCIVPKGAFYVMLNTSACYGKAIDGKPVTDSLSFAAVLLEVAEVAVVPGAGFEDDAFQRLSYATSMEKIVEGMDRLEKFLDQLA